MAKNLNCSMLTCIGAGGGVSEPGLNRRPDFDCLRYGGGLKILWRRPSWVQVPPPPPNLFCLLKTLCSQINWQKKKKRKGVFFTVLWCLEWLFLVVSTGSWPLLRQRTV